MSVPFDQSQTRVNLMRAFAGESLARNRYTFASALAKEKQLFLVARAFQYTADQEKEHAEIFCDLLSDLNGQSIRIDGAYPVNTGSTVLDQLRDARHNEFEEFETVYPAFEEAAREEGFGQIGDAFADIAKIERTHGQRFGQFAAALEDGTLFRSECPVAWLCLNCGHIHFGTEAPAACPVCHHDQGYFIRSSLVPFLVRPE